MSGATRERLRARAGRVRRSGPPDDHLVWVLGSPRSGSTWLLQLLGDHPAVVPINEPLIGWYLGPFMSDLPGMSAEDLGIADFTLRRVQANTSQQFFAEEFSDVWLPGLATLLRDRFRAHALRYPAAVAPSKAYVVIKEPNGSQSADLLARALPESRLLFLLRDGRDVVDSELAANLPGSWVTGEFPGARGIGEADRLEFVVQSAKKWLWRTEVVEAAYAAHAGPRLLVRYEDLRAEPAEHLARLFAWMGIRIDDADLQTLIDRHSFERLPAEARGPQKFFRSATPGGWRENLTAEEQEALARVIGPKLAELGYSG